MGRVRLLGGVCALALARTESRETYPTGCVIILITVYSSGVKHQSGSAWVLPGGG